MALDWPDFNISPSNFYLEGAIFMCKKCHNFLLFSTLVGQRRKGHLFYELRRLWMALIF